MKKIYKVLALGLVSVGLAACQTTAQQYNGRSGYKVIEQTKDTATLAYVLSGSTKNDERKFQASCQEVLGTNKTYTVKVLTMQEVPNKADNGVGFGRQIGNSRTSISLTDSPSLHDSEGYATRYALDATPTMLRAVTFTCS